MTSAVLPLQFLNMFLLITMAKGVIHLQVVFVGFGGGGAQFSKIFSKC